VKDNFFVVVVVVMMLVSGLETNAIWNWKKYRGYSRHDVVCVCMCSHFTLDA